MSAGTWSDPGTVTGQPVVAAPHPHFTPLRGNVEVRSFRPECPACGQQMKRSLPCDPDFTKPHWYCSAPTPICRG